MTSDRPGRSFESSSTTRHAIEPRIDPREQAKKRFLTDIAAELGRDAQAEKFDELILVVTRAQAHAMQEALDTATRAKVRAVMTKDLVKSPNAEIWERLIEDGLLPRRPPPSAMR